MCTVLATVTVAWVIKCDLCPYRHPCNIDSNWFPWKSKVKMLDRNDHPLIMNSCYSVTLTHSQGVSWITRVSLWTDSLFGEGVKNRSEGKERQRACRQTFEATILPSCNCCSKSVSKIVIYHLDKLECFDFLWLLFLVSIICPLMQEHFLWPLLKRKSLHCG